jgi:hypothetical protein
MSDVLFWQQSDEFMAGEVATCCPRCEYSLTLHQPDPELPDRLLATCDECKAWFLTDSDGVKLIAIPTRRDDGKTGRSTA